MPEPLLSLSGVQTHIGRYHILHGVDLEVPEGGVTMLLGRNGAGKTTTLRTVIGHWKASAGTIRFGGEDITGWPTPRRARAGIADVPERARGSTRSFRPSRRCAPSGGTRRGTCRAVRSRCCRWPAR